MKRKNTRSLDEIADGIHRLERANIVGVGDLLLEAQNQCEYGQWLQWLRDSEFGMSVDTAENYIKVAILGSRFRNLRNLRLGETTLYSLARHKPEDELPAIIEELEKHATRKCLVPRAAERVIRVGTGRHRFGGYPDATLVQLVEVDDTFVEPWREKAIASLRKDAPTTDDVARTIVGKINRERMRAEHAASMDAFARDLKSNHEAAAEAEAILDGSPPELPPPTIPPESQRLHAETDWAETEQFVRAVTDLLELRGKPVSRLIGQFTPAELCEVADFLNQIATATKGKAA